jgi:hypothetical protein
VQNILSKIEKCKQEGTSEEKRLEIFQGWQAYAKWANTRTLRKKVARKISSQA